MISVFHLSPRSRVGDSIEMRDRDGMAEYSLARQASDAGKPRVADVERAGAKKS